ncbi:MAG: hypothetical protein EXR62_01155 [Chloroflexi bacterium]|nr:hypothetical protein [Chloroflexota bacterium]
MAQQQEQQEWYRILQVDPAAEPEVVEAAYRRLARKYHPDVNPALDASDRMKYINLAWEILRDPARRQAYDRQREKVEYSWEPPPPPRPARPKPEPILHVSPGILDFGELDRGDSRTMEVHLVNVGDGKLRGSILRLDRWVVLSAARIRDNRATLQITIHTKSLAKGREYHSGVNIKSNGGELIVPIRVQIKALSNPDSLVQRYYERGQAYFDRAEWNKAILEFTKVIVLDPSHIDAFISRGEAQRILGHDEDALYSFNEALKLDPHYAAALHGRGLTYRATGHLVEAEKDLFAAASLDSAYREDLEELLAARNGTP